MSAAPGAPPAPPVLEARGLVKRFALRGAGLVGARRAVVHAVDGVSFAVNEGETLALVGESGCGKTTLARTAALLHAPSAGTVLYRGRDLTCLSRARLKPVRRRIQMMFQDPFGSLDPRMRVGAIVAEPLEIHRLGGPRARRRARVAEALQSVGLAAADAGRYPHEFSGGQRQRIALARALVAEPELLIADEPVSALDVSIQSQVLNLMKDLKERLGLALLFISHDLAVVDFLADRVAVMYLGRIVETGPRESVYRTPAHPYTAALLKAVPTMDAPRRRRVRGRAGAIAGDVPSPVDPPPGCAFHPRCPYARDVCRRVTPALDPVPGDGARDAGRRAACHFSDEVRAQEARR